ncbi:MFS transporter superfamily [Sesbania bispinosa]|nr:MFS transporter superfamily [Sesbania bispinosa]
MAIERHNDVETREVNGLQDLQQPFIQHGKDIESNKRVENGSIGMVGYSAPTQAAIREDLNLSLAQVFHVWFFSNNWCNAWGCNKWPGYGFHWPERGNENFNRILHNRMDPTSLDMGRFFTGYGIGVISFLMIVIGASVSFLIGSVLNWRQLALAGLVPCISLLIGLWFIPESPRWLAKVGLEKEFQVALRRLRGKDVDISQEADEILVLSKLP